jgi:hypothetical protein
MPTNTPATRLALASDFPATSRITSPGETSSPKEQWQQWQSNA